MLFRSDEDYNPELNEVTCSSGNETEETDSEKFDLSNSSTCNSHSDKINFGEAGECEIMHRPRQRKYVDYMKLHDVSLMDSMLLHVWYFL